MPATSSTLGLADIALAWSNGSADVVRIDFDLASDAGLETACLLSLMLDRRANDDDPLPGAPDDKRGWWADDFADVEGDKTGSRLWLLERSVLTSENRRRAEQYALEACQWMIDDKVATEVNVTVETKNQQLSLGVEIVKPNGDRVAFKFGHVWDAMSA